MSMMHKGMTSNIHIQDEIHNSVRNINRKHNLIAKICRSKHSEGSARVFIRKKKESHTGKAMQRTTVDPLPVTHQRPSGAVWLRQFKTEMNQAASVDLHDYEATRERKGEWIASSTTASSRLCLNGCLRKDSRGKLLSRQGICCSLLVWLCFCFS